MEAALVSASTGVLKPLLSKLTKLLGEEYAKLKGVRKQIKFLRDELSAMGAALQMLGDAEELNPHMRDWRDNVRELAYDIEDCIDAFMDRVDHDHDAPTGLKGLFSRLKKLKARHEIANEIEELKARATEVSERHKRYNFIEPKSNSSTSAIDPRLPALYEDIDRLVGIDGPKKHIIEWLNVDSAELKVLPIVGCGGLGKTTLANQVYHTMKDKYLCAAFVSVSRNPNMRKILRDIAKEVDITDGTLKDDDDERQLINKLRKHLQNKRYFVVIDDVWDANAWEFMKLVLLNNNCGSRVIVTTRSVAVASRCSSQSGYIYELMPLNFNDSRRLFFKRAFGSESSHYPHLEGVPDEILAKCGGLPLALITLSSMLANQHAKAEWDRVLNAIGSRLARDPNAESMTKILSLSFFDLPHHLQTCLLYLSVFPEDYRIRKRCLINRWIAEGFIHEEKEQSAYEIGESYFNDLINRSMIIPIGVKYGQAKACQVHDIILDYIKCKADEENFVTSIDVAEHVYTSKYKVRRLCVNNRNEEHVTLWASLILSQIRSLTIFGRPVRTSFFPFTALRVLDLGDCTGMKDHHLASIEKLFQLEYLRLGPWSLTELPEKIGELQNIQTLDLRGTGIKKLSPAITKLQRLAHLYVEWTAIFPDGMIGQMHNLEGLIGYGVRSYEQAKSLQEFSKLTKLRTLKIICDLDLPNSSEGVSQAAGINSYVGTLLSSCNLHNLSISDFFDEEYLLSLDCWHPATPCRLQKLCIKSWKIYKVPNSMRLLGNLRVLELFVIFLRAEDVEILGAIPSLLYLKLGTNGGTNGRIIIQGNNGFSFLKYFCLYIDYCGTSLEFKAGSMSKLEHIKLEFPVHTMECLNGVSDLGIQHLSALSKVDVRIHGYVNIKSYHNLADDNIIKCVTRAINASIKILPNCPTISFDTWPSYCEHFNCGLKRFYQRFSVSTEWLKMWPVEEEDTEQETSGETEKEDCEMPSWMLEIEEEVVEEQTDEKEEETNAEDEQEQQEDNIRSN